MAIGKLYASVRWGNCMSGVFHITAGVRTSRVLSPALFAVFVDDILEDKLDKYNIGCLIKHICMNSFFYVNDLVLIAISRSAH